MESIRVPPGLEACPQDAGRVPTQRTFYQRTKVQWTIAGCLLLFVGWVVAYCLFPVFLYHGVMGKHYLPGTVFIGRPYNFWVITFLGADIEQNCFFAMCVSFALLPWAILAALMEWKEMMGVIREVCHKVKGFVGGGCQAFREALYIELHRQPTVMELAEGASEHDIATRHVYKDAQPLGPHCDVTEGDIRAMYAHDQSGNAEKVILVLKLGLGLLAFGHCTVDAEKLVLTAAKALRMPSPFISIGHRQVPSPSRASLERASSVFRPLGKARPHMPHPRLITSPSLTTTPPPRLSCLSFLARSRR